MSDAMSLGELSELHVELLPARTLLSLLRAGTPGAGGEPGTPGAKGHSISQFSFLRMFDWGGSNSGNTHSLSISDASSSTHSSSTK